MEWSWREALHLFHHLPHALHDLAHREDQGIVRAGLEELKLIHGDGGTHRLILPKEAATHSIQKEEGFGQGRSEENLGLLLKDYLASLPGFEAQGHASEALLEHWRRILLEQPERLAQAHVELTAGERARRFWRERLKGYRTDIDGADMPHPVDDWERAAGTLPTPMIFQGDSKRRQWQDLVIRQRLHQLDLDNMKRG